MTKYSKYPTFKRAEDGRSLTMTIEDNRYHKIKDLEMTIKSLLEANQNLRCCGNCKNWSEINGECKSFITWQNRAGICSSWELPEDWR